MSKFDAAIPFTYTTASAYAVCTQDALFHGISAIVGATATAGRVVVYSGVNTSVPVFALVTPTSGSVTNDGPITPIVCAGGINITCTGTAYNTVVLYTKL